MTSPLAPLRVAVAGLGTVGAATVQILRDQADLLRTRCGRAIDVVAVSARDRNKDRGFPADAYRWETDPLALAAIEHAEVIVETIGGADGVARKLVEAALKNGKHVVTANKALLAEHGLALAALAEKHNAVLAYEAAIAGGIPIVKSLREGLAANRIDKLVGILNGTSNFILTHMENEGSGFDEALAEASRLGYAEADPSFDVDGYDAAQKLSILTALAFGCRPDYGAIHIEGIRHISKTDMQFADDLGYSIKLLGITRRTASGAIEQRVHPCMLPADSPVGADDVYNAIVIEGDSVGRVTLEGRGAGGGPTASSIVADLCDIARGVRYPPFTLPLAQLADLPFVPMDELRSAYYLRLAVLDQPGVLAQITRIFAEEEISMRSCLQRSRQPEQAVQIVLTTHVTSEAAMNRATAKIAALDMVTERPHLIRMEEFGE